MSEIFIIFTIGKRPCLHHLINLDIMFIPYDLVILLILSPFLLLLWIAARIVKLAVNLVLRLVKNTVKLIFRVLVVLLAHTRHYFDF